MESDSKRELTAGGILNNMCGDVFIRGDYFVFHGQIIQPLLFDGGKKFKYMYMYYMATPPLHNQCMYLCDAT